MLPPDPGPPLTLRDVLRATPRLAPDRAARVLDGIGRALAARDGAYGALTPERVLVGAHDAVVLAPAPRPGMGVAPWPAYLAPEQIDGRPADARSDVYAMGLLGWEMLAGRQPWEGDSLYGIVVKQREQDLPRLSTLRPGLPRPLVQAIEGALHKDPGDRWESPAELTATLGGLAGRVRAEPEPFVTGVPAPSRPALAPSATWDRPAAPFAARDASPQVEAPAALEAPAHRAAPATRRRPRAQRRWLTLAVVLLAVLAAGSGAYAVVRGRQDTSATQAWLDSATAGVAAAGGARGAAAAAAPAATTRENTTSVPIRRSGGRRADPDETPSTDAEDVAPPPEEPAIEPTPPFVPDVPRNGRPPRPTVPQDTALRRDTLVEPPPPSRR